MTDSIMEQNSSLSIIMFIVVEVQYPRKNLRGVLGTTILKLCRKPSRHQLELTVSPHELLLGDILKGQRCAGRCICHLVRGSLPVLCREAVSLQRKAPTCKSSGRVFPPIRSAPCLVVAHSFCSCFVIAANEEPEMTRFLR
ncbi:uncharacterized protein LOC135377771 isoform X1 [Ornithodoros turicata]|uniref:uncharacterized protein LOC135377771 isoform X1 n=1 Tax=Ornithodoros turicata TaxID=34597 RepID=UPI00313A232A